MTGTNHLWDIFLGNPTPWGNEVATMTTGFTSARASFQQQLSEFPGPGPQLPRVPLSPSKTTILNTTTHNSKTSGFGKPKSWAATLRKDRTVTDASRGRANSQNAGILDSQTKLILIEELSSSPPTELPRPLRSRGTSTSPVRDPPTGSANVIGLKRPSSSLTSQSPTLRPSPKSRGRSTAGRPGPSSPIKSYFPRASSTRTSPRSRKTTIGPGSVGSSMVARSTTTLCAARLNPYLPPPDSLRKPSSALHRSTAGPSSILNDKPVAPPVTSGATMDTMTVTTAPKIVGRKRLGMGRTTVGYPNKKFKTPT